jgi:MFS family permease
MSALATYRALLANRPIARLLTGEFVSSIGDWLYLVALLVVVYRESDDPLLLGLVGAARVLPYVVLSVPAGIAADRFDRRLVLLTTDLARGACMVVLAWLVFTDGPLLGIVGVAILATCFSAFFGPAIGAYLPALVRDERELGPANSAWASLDNLAFIVGPGLAGLLLAFTDLGLAFVLNAITFAFVAAVLWTLPPSRPSTEPATSQEASTGGAPTASTAPSGEGPTIRSMLRPLAGLTVLDMAGGFVIGGLGVMTVLLATDQLGAGDEVTGYLNAAIGVGGLIGAIAAGALVLRPRLGPPLLGGAVVVAVGLTALGATDLVAVALVAMAATSTGSLVIEVVGTTVFQRVVPDRIRGRALGGIMTLSTLAYAAGALVIPVLADRIGALPVLATGGVAIVIASLGTVWLVGAGLRRVDDAAAMTLRRVAGLPLFAGVPPAALEAAIGRLRPLDVAAGQVIVSEGEPSDRFYIIEAGTFGVDQRSPAGGSERLRELGPDQVFGELGLLRRAPRSATVSALTDGRLLCLEADDFLALVGSGPGLSVRLLELYRGPTVARG